MTSGSEQGKVGPSELQGVGKNVEDELEMKLKESHISDDKHVIIPNHLHVPEAEKLGFCFGSFDATFGFNKTPSNLNGLVAVTVSEMTSEASEEADETIEDQMQSRFSNYLIQHAIMHTFIVRNSLILSTTGPTPTTATQTVRVMQSSISVTQQPLPIFQQPSGVHLPHYPPNYIPYGPYFSLFYVPPPAAIHQFLSNRTFPQQPQQGAGGMYPAPPPPVAATSNSKYPLPQYMPRSNTWNIGMTGSYGPYASAAPAGYNFASVAANSMESFRP
ncbi:GBF-interacting protein 1-like [Lactuca sativa]|uniref:GBF-interacting protein 1-like n=1 Tax=Lactuca sativa TaxID=4236 RepID=UPI000CD9457F|nr:GBF-interacting protein 1-like [Lactuca sativa]